MSSNIYRVGDFVYYESFPSTPYQIRRIDELIKTSNGQIEAKVTCYYRRRDLPASLLKIADQAEHQNQILGRPRRCLLSRHPLTTPNGAGPADEDGVGGAAGSSVVVSNGIAANSSSNGNGGDAKKDADEDVKIEVDTPTEENDDKSADAKPDKKLARSYGFAGLPQGACDLPLEQVHVLRQRELFLSRQTESLITSHIRGKCSVEILSEVVTCEMYLNNEDAFFYSLVYDPANQTLLADKGKIEIGERHQATVPEWTGGQPPAENGHPDDMEDDEDENKENGALKMVEDDGMDDGGDVKPAPATAGLKPRLVDGVPVTEREHLVYHPHHSLSDADIDRFMVLARAVGTFSRALESSSTVKLPSLHITASAASRDVTLLHAMALLHCAHYDIGKAVKSLVLVPDDQSYPTDVDQLVGHRTVSHCGPILCRDQLEEWSAAEATLFEEAMEKYGKDFHDIRADCLPWKSVRDIVEYYYMWKTTGRYTEMQKTKMAEKEKQLKQVFVGTHNKISPSVVPPHNTTQELVKSLKPCESCKATESLQWYYWGPTQLHMRLCADCWTVWRKRGGLKREHEFENYDLDGVGETSAAGGQPQQSSVNATAAGGQRNSVGGRNAHNRGAIPAASVMGVPRTDAFGARIPQAMAAAAALKGALTGHFDAPDITQPHNNSSLAGTRARVTFYLNTTLQARIARRITPKSILNMRKAARAPFRPINSRAVLQYYHSRNMAEVLRAAQQVRRGRLTPAVLEALGRSHNANNMLAAMIAASQQQQQRR